jgi:hypothetical protein
MLFLMEHSKTNTKKEEGTELAFTAKMNKQYVGLKL